MMNLYKEPVGNTCPVINDAQEELRRVSAQMLKYEKETTEQNFTVLVEELYNWRLVLEDMENTLEDLRDSNSALRNWGNNLIDEIARIEEEHELEIIELEKDEEI